MIKNTHPHISIVSPEYNGEKMVQQLVDRITTAVSSITDNFEIILVNDASPDNTWTEIEKACAKDKRVKGLNLSRNFGQHYIMLLQNFRALLHYRDIPLPSSQYGLSVD